MAGRAVRGARGLRQERRQRRGVLTRKRARRLVAQARAQRAVGMKRSVRMKRAVGMVRVPGVPGRGPLERVCGWALVAAVALFCALVLWVAVAMGPR